MQAIDFLRSQGYCKHIHRDVLVSGIYMGYSIKSSRRYLRKPKGPPNQPLSTPLPRATPTKTPYLYKSTIVPTHTCTHKRPTHYLVTLSTLGILNHDLWGGSDVIVVVVIVKSISIRDDDNR